MSKYLLIFAVLMVGCGHPSGGSAPIISSLQGAALEQALVSQGLSFGLSAMKDQVAANAAAQQLNMVISNTIQPYLSGDVSNVPSNVIDTLLKEQMFTTLPQDVQLLISAAASLANSYLPVPSATTYLSQDELNYLRGLVNGLQSGANLYLAGHVTKAPRGLLREQSKWLNFKSPSR